MGKYDGHTPEPWEVRIWEGDEWPDKRVSIGKAETNGRAIAMNPRYISKDDFMADAKLIADAPKLLRERDEVVRQLLYHQHECSVWAMYHKHSSLCGDCNSCVVLKRIEEASNG